MAYLVPLFILLEASKRVWYLYQQHIKRWVRDMTLLKLTIYMEKHRK